VGLYVNSNIGAMNAYRNLSVTNDSMSKSLEKLSSGYRINRAADDAAGLAISEGLRSQIGGLKVAVRNTQDGISVVQTAEGALTETHSILQRMRDLSVQASNDASLNSSAKSNIQSEITQLKAELDRIAGTTSFNGKKLLDGSFTGQNFQVGANAGETIGVNIATAMGSAGLGVSGVDVTGTGKYASAAAGTAAGTVVLSTAATGAADGVLTMYKEGAAGSNEFSGANYNVQGFRNLSGTVAFGGKSFDLGSVTYADTDTAAQALTKLNAAAASAFGLATGATPFAAATATSMTFTTPANVSGYTDAAGALSATAGDVAKATPVYTSSSGASAAISAIDTAIGTVSTTRANLGALQNRFEHTINNLNVTVENLTASDSRIRDTDMAQEMTNFTRAQILTQAGTAMLAQANQAPQGILKLLG
jgi:flagellin-like hook-associated protein FlgL